MITLSEHQVSGQRKEQVIIAEPNRSANWQQNKWLVCALGLWCFITATAFALIGAWVVLPFAGIEITALALALYIACWKLSQRHVLRFYNDRLIIEKGVYYPRQVWNLSKHNLSISVERQHHPWDPLKISLCENNASGSVEQIPIGEFLNKDDSKKLLLALRQKGLMVRNDSSQGTIKL